MITFEEACRIAVDYFKENTDCIALYSARESTDMWIFSGDTEDGSLVIGGQPITVNKENGTVEIFELPDFENFRISREATEVVVPDEFRR